MTDFYTNLSTEDKINLLEKILPMELELQNMANLSQERDERGLGAALTETRIRLMVERNRLLSSPVSLTERLSSAATGALEELNRTLKKIA